MSNRFRDSAYVIRVLQEDKETLGPAKPFTVDLRGIDAGFITFATRFAGSQGHLPFSTLTYLAEAWGMGVTGVHALAMAKDPNIIVWSNSSPAFLNHLLYLIQQDETSPHPCHISEYTEAVSSFGPPFPELEESYDFDTATFPIPEPAWCPMVICAERTGLAKTLLDQLIAEKKDQLSSLLKGLGEAVSRAFESQPEAEAGVYTDRFSKN